MPLQDNTTSAASAQNVQNGTTPSGTAAGTLEKPVYNRQQRQRGPPEDGVASKTKVMVANLPYDLTEEKVCFRPLTDTVNLN